MCIRDSVSALALNDRDWKDAHHLSLPKTRVQHAQSKQRILERVRLSMKRRSTVEKLRLAALESRLCATRKHLFMLERPNADTMPTLSKHQKPWWKLGKTLSSAIVFM